VVGFGAIGTYLLSHSNAATPGVSGATYRVWTWNIAGEKINKGDATTGITQVAVHSIVSRNIDLAAFNEICKDQYIDIIKRLEDAGWNKASKFSYFSVAIKTSGSCNGRGGGNAIFIKNGIGDVDVMKLADDVVKERRNLLCSTIGKTSDTFCTTHISIKNMSNGKPADTVQIGEVRDKVEQYYKSGRRVIIAGDFNAQPSYARLDGWYAPSVNTAANGNNHGAYREIDDLDARCPGYGERTENANDKTVPCASGSKIDLIFFRENLVSHYDGDSLSISKECTGGTSCSDHRILYGTVTFK